MKKLILILLLAPSLMFGQAIVGTKGTTFTAGVPAHTPSILGAWTAVDTVTNYEYNYDFTSGTWKFWGHRIQFTGTYGAPSYTPDKFLSPVAVNIGDSLYVHQGGWNLLSGGGGPEINDLTAAVTWANVPDANITQSSVVQHEAALTITESQISDLNHTVNTDNQTLSFSSPNLSISGGNSVNLAAIVSGYVTGSGTTNELPYWASSSSLGSLSTATYPNLTELSYVKGLTSSAQNQLNAKHGGSLTTGYVPYSSAGGYGLANSGMYWDNANGRFGILTSTPIAALQVDATGTWLSGFNNNLRLKGVAPSIHMLENGNKGWSIGSSTNLYFGYTTDAFVGHTYLFELNATSAYVGFDKWRTRTETSMGIARTGSGRMAFTTQGVDAMALNAPGATGRQVLINSLGSIGFDASGSSALGYAADVSLYREVAGALGVGNGTYGTPIGDIRAGGIRLNKTGSGGSIYIDSGYGRNIGLPINPGGNTTGRIAWSTYGDNIQNSKAYLLGSGDGKSLGIGVAPGTNFLSIGEVDLAGSGSLAGSLLNLTQTWNTTGSPTAIKLNVTNTASGSSANLMDLQVGETSMFKVNPLGVATAQGFTLAAGSLHIKWAGQSTITSNSDGVLAIWNAARSDFNRLQFGGTTSSFPSIKRSTVNLQARLADDSGYTDVEVLDETYGAGWNGSNEVPTKNAVYDKIEAIPANTDNQDFTGSDDGTTFTWGLSGAANDPSITEGQNITMSRSGEDVTISVDRILDDNVYTPAGTDSTNVASVTIYQAQYSRVGSTVTVSGFITITPAGAGSCRYEFNPPVPSNFTSPFVGCAGNFNAADSHFSGSISSNTTSDSIRIAFTAPDGSAHPISYHYTYRIL